MKASTGEALGTAETGMVKQTNVMAKTAPVFQEVALATCKQSSFMTTCTDMQLYCVKLTYVTCNNFVYVLVAFSITAQSHWSYT